MPLEIPWHGSTYRVDKLDLSSGGVSIGGRAGVEIMAGAHAGFNIDFIGRYLVFNETYDEKDPSGRVLQSFDLKVVTPALGVGGGLNIYF
jgi:hypothetical protein